MPPDERLRVVLCWHMHQPDYRDPRSRSFRAPWTYLHALKDYPDMAFHLEQHPGAVAVVNFSPVLLDQLADLSRRLAALVAAGTPSGEPLADALASPVLGHDEHERRALIAACLRADERRLVQRFEPYAQLVALARGALGADGGLAYLDDRFVSDLLVWYHLAWLGESVRRTDERVARLVAKRSHYSIADRRELVELVAGLVAAVPARYAALAAQQRVELSTSPWGHPILPLLLDFGAARATHRDAPLPVATGYPGGMERARWHLAEARRAFRASFGVEPQGCWPSEGALCDASLALIGAAGFRWAASGEGVLRHTLGAPRVASDALHRRYRRGDGPVSVFFRDDALSDLIGFTYKEWHGDDAAADLVRRLEAIADEPAAPGRVVAIVLDGENAWEHYPANGYWFLAALYGALADHPRLRLTTFARCADDPAVEARALPPLTAGSWVYGDLATWIGQPDKNRAWDMLAAAKHCIDGCGAERVDDAVRHQLAVCEGSDWFWWPGEYNPAPTVAQFERIFRLQLAGLYRAARCDPPEDLARPFTHGGGHPEGGGTMRPSG